MLIADFVCLPFGPGSVRMVYQIFFAEYSLHAAVNMVDESSVCGETKQLPERH